MIEEVLLYVELFCKETYNFLKITNYSHIVGTLTEIQIYFSNRERRRSVIWQLNRLRSETNSRPDSEAVGVSGVLDEERSNSPSSSGVNSNNADSNGSRNNTSPMVRNYRFPDAFSRVISHFRSTFSQDTSESNATATAATTATSTSTSTSTSTRSAGRFDRIFISDNRNNAPSTSSNTAGSSRSTATVQSPNEDLNNAPPQPSLSSSAGNSRPESDDESQDDNLLLETYMRVRPGYLRSRILRRRFRRRAERFYNTSLDTRRREMVSLFTIEFNLKFTLIE